MPSCALQQTYSILPASILFRARVCFTQINSCTVPLQTLRPKLSSSEVQSKLCKLLQQHVQRCEEGFVKAQAQLQPLMVQLECVACDNPETVVVDQLLLPLLRERLHDAAVAHETSLVAAAEAAAAEILQAEV